MEQARVRN